MDEKKIMNLFTSQVFCLLVVGTFCNSAKKPKKTRAKNSTSPRTAATYPRCVQEAYKNYFSTFAQNFTEAGEGQQVKVTRGRDNSVTRTLTNDTDQDCPSEPNYGLNHPTKQRSLCPWRSVNDNDPLRYPENIIVAECLCNNGCVGFPTGVCERVYYNVPVLRLVGANLCRWKRDWYPVAIGCTCSFAPRKSQTAVVEKQMCDETEVEIDRF